MQVFPEPHLFKPERFLTADGELKKIDEFVPFGLGKRQCLGESLARMELFLFTANIFNQFRVRGTKRPRSTSFSVLFRSCQSTR